MLGRFSSHPYRSLHPIYCLRFASFSIRSQFFECNNHALLSLNYLTPATRLEPPTHGLEGWRSSYCVKQMPSKKRIFTPLCFVLLPSSWWFALLAKLLNASSTTAYSTTFLYHNYLKSILKEHSCFLFIYIFTIHYHLQVQANQKKIVQKTQCYF